LGHVARKLNAMMPRAREYSPGALLYNSFRLHAFVSSRLRVFAPSRLRADNQTLRRPPRRAAAGGGLAGAGAVAGSGAVPGLAAVGAGDDTLAANGDAVERLGNPLDVRGGDLDQRERVLELDSPDLGAVDPQLLGHGADEIGRRDAVVAPDAGPDLSGGRGRAGSCSGVARGNRGRAR